MAKTKKNSNYNGKASVATKPTAEETLAAKRKKKNIRDLIIIGVSLLVLAGIFLGLAFGLGLFDYSPEPTKDVSMAVGDLGSLHIELYGNDAGVTTEHFLKLCTDKYFTKNYLTFHTIKDGKVYFGSLIADNGKNTTSGEFSANGVDNKVLMKRGSIVLARGEGYDSGYGQFFILTEDAPELMGEYAVFGRVTDGMDIIDKLVKDAKVDENGLIAIEDRPAIGSTSSHDSHSH